MTKIQIPHRDDANANLSFPLTIRLNLTQRRTADLMASVNGYSTTSEFVRDLLTNASAQMMLDQQQAA